MKFLKKLESKLYRVATHLLLTRIIVIHWNPLCVLIGLILCSYQFHCASQMKENIFGRISCENFRKHFSLFTNFISSTLFETINVYFLIKITFATFSTIFNFGSFQTHFPQISCLCFFCSVQETKKIVNFWDFVGPLRKFVSRSSHPLIFKRITLCFKKILRSI